MGANNWKEVPTAKDLGIHFGQAKYSAESKYWLTCDFWVDGHPGKKGNWNFCDCSKPFHKFWLDHRHIVQEDCGPKGPNGYAWAKGTNIESAQDINDDLAHSWQERKKLR